MKMPVIQFVNGGLEPFTPNIELRLDLSSQRFPINDSLQVQLFTWHCKSNWARVDSIKYAERRCDYLDVGIRAGLVI